MGRVSLPVLILAKIDGATVRTGCEKIPACARRVSKLRPRLTDGQRIVTSVENEIGASHMTPKRRNVVQGRTANGRDTAGRSLLVDYGALLDMVRRLRAHHS